MGFRCLKFALFGILAVLAFSFVTMLLWNWLMPGIFHLRELSFIEALGLLALSKILFSGFGRRGGCHHHGGWRERWQGRWKEKMKEKLDKMSPEEREKFKAKMARCCGTDFEEKEPSKE